jgi:methenyltetrahydrofolate cyclohydrolase
MKTSSSIAQMRVEHLIDAVSGKQVSPGSGAAGAVTLALAAACAAKAATISMQHQPEHSGLQRAQETLERVAHFALAGADRDAEAFTAFIKGHTLGAIAQLIREGDKLARLIDVVSATVDELAPHIEPNMAGDLVAARALVDAARRIQSANLAEAKASAAAGENPDPDRDS